MPKLNLTFAEVLEILLANGFELHREGKGSHKIYKATHSGKVWIVVLAPHRKSDTVPKGTLMNIVRTSGLNKDLFKKN